MPTDAVTVSRLVTTLGPTVCRALTTDTDALEREVSATVVFDALDDLPDLPGGILLMVGLAPDDDSVCRIISAAASRGCSAVAIKLRGQSTVDLKDVVSTIAVVAVNDEVSWSHFDELLTAVTSRQSADGMNSETGLFDLANAVAMAAGGSVAIEDLDRKVLAYSNLDGQVVDDMRRSGILARRVPNLSKNESQYRSVMRASGVVHFPSDPEDGELARCAAAIRAGRAAVGSIWVIEQDGPVDTDQEAAILEACRLASIQILRARSSHDLERQVRSEWLRSLLYGHPGVPATASRFGMLPGVDSVLAGFMLCPDANSVSPPVHELATTAEQYCGVFRANVSSVAIGHVVYVLLPAVRSSDMPERLVVGTVDAIEARLGCSAIAAMSSADSGAHRISALRTEVDAILAVIAAGGDLPRVAARSDVHAQLRLQELLERERRPRAEHPGVARLLEYDQRRGTEYRLSLLAHLAQPEDTPRAAATLGIHPNTLRYRVRRAKELFDIRLDGPDDRLVTWLDLRLASEEWSPMASDVGEDNAPC